MGAYLCLALCVKVRLEPTNIWMIHDLHYLQLSILYVTITRNKLSLSFSSSSSSGCQRRRRRCCYMCKYLESLVLQDLFDSCIFAGGSQLGLIYDAKGPMPDNFVVRVLELDILACFTVFCCHAYYPLHVRLASYFVHRQYSLVAFFWSVAASSLVPGNLN